MARDRRWSGWWVVGPALGVWIAGMYALALVVARVRPFSSLAMAGETLLLVVMAGGLVAGGWLARRDAAPEASSYAGYGTLVGAAAVTVIGSALVLSDGLDGLLDGVHNTLVATAIGGIAGLFVGRARGKTVAAARTLAAQRDAFVFLNRLLRHHVLNGTNVISGNAAAVADRTTEEAIRERATTIEDRSDAISRLVDEMRWVAETLTDEMSPKPVDAVELLEQEVSTLRRSFPNATVTVDVPPTAMVYGGEFLAVAFEHLLTNAVVHNDAAEPRVRVTVERAGDEVCVVVSDNGPGLEFDTPFEPLDGEERGTGLYLVDALVTAAGGDVTAETDEGAVLTVALRGA